MERWIEITGSIIDDSKQLVIDVDEHMGRVSDHLSGTAHEGEYTLLDRNPADSTELWNEQDGLRHRFYDIKALLDERKQYQNDVTPATVKRAVSQYFSSFQAYVKATIDIWSFFEEVSRDGPFSVLHCPTCDEELETDSEFCRHCGAEIDFSDHETGDQAEQVGQQWDQLHKTFNEAADEMQIDMVEMDIAMNEASPNDTAVEWEYCPNCGFKNSVWVDTPREATCRFCQAKWKKRGILFTKWEMVDGNYAGEAVADDEWERRGRTKHGDREFEDRLRTHH
ncbi:zinc ribbon domain-containing protein [Saliphagus sp. LR7]|uniref:zinc ribbon domain-containing protein n=1 Tax=Saliphagus sp. LR7 TaxID=2282654 RepID=UPI001E54D473|nr:zinc ribbon domain-containing protein [Saliphagus sp. LR7]